MALMVGVFAVAMILAVRRANRWQELGGLKPQYQYGNSLKTFSAEQVTRGSSLRELRRLKVNREVKQIIPQPAVNRVCLRYEKSIDVLDATSGAVLRSEQPTHRFTDFCISPDGSMVYAADYGGEVIGYSRPQGTHYVHRYDVAADRWASAPAPKTAFRIEAVDAERFILLEGDQWVSLSLNYWRSHRQAIEETARTRCRDGINCIHEGDCRYDAIHGRLLHGSSNFSNPTITAFDVQVQTLRTVQFTRGDNYSISSPPGGSTILSSDGRHFYFGPLQVDAFEVTKNLRTMPSIIIGATADLAMTEDEYVDAGSGVSRGRWGFKPAAIGVSIRGDQVCAYAPETSELVFYEVTP